MSGSRTCDVSGASVLWEDGSNPRCYERVCDVSGANAVGRHDEDDWDDDEDCGKDDGKVCEFLGETPRRQDLIVSGGKVVEGGSNSISQFCRAIVSSYLEIDHAIDPGQIQDQCRARFQECAIWQAKCGKFEKR